MGKYPLLTTPPSPGRPSGQSGFYLGGEGRGGGGGRLVNYIE